jgi:hypothetical protein
LINGWERIEDFEYMMLSSFVVYLFASQNSHDKFIVDNKHVIMFQSLLLVDLDVYIVARNF